MAVLWAKGWSPLMGFIVVITKTKKKGLSKFKPINIWI